VTGLLISLAVMAAVGAVWWRWQQQRRRQRRQPGATIRLPIVVAGFDEIDAMVENQRCTCGGMLALSGETSRRVGDRRYRVVRLICQDCGREQQLYFDVTTVFH
jgi:hypothetical protein